MSSLDNCILHSASICAKSTRQDQFYWNIDLSGELVKCLDKTNQIFSRLHRCQAKDQPLVAIRLAGYIIRQLDHRWNYSNLGGPNVKPRYHLCRYIRRHCHNFMRAADS
ncbi:protein of unknown function [Candidatus Hydrogenisulfobacillus filiaventi]|uniref:Uncharacterized protein n=1 Tax=Candidatus Hydrogenisulfobacillus filiaventi TaxID=2707344 RepID=A0A6F8ZD77_9FIRM|nr:protein of unknown function [Candidatus Hydrogenisulfobacillus filiaventi]